MLLDDLAGEETQMIFKAGQVYPIYKPEYSPNAAAQLASRLEQELNWLANRTNSEVEDARKRILKASRPACPLPVGKSLADMVEGKWPGDETDEQVTEALERLS